MTVKSQDAINQEINSIKNDATNDIASHDIAKLNDDLGRILSVIQDIDATVKSYNDQIDEDESEKKSVHWYDPSSWGANNDRLDDDQDRLRGLIAPLQTAEDDLRTMLATVQTTFDNYTVSSSDPVPAINLMFKKMFKNIDIKNISASQLADLRALMVQVMAIIQVVITKLANEKADLQNRISNASVFNAQETTMTTESDIKKNAEIQQIEEDKAKSGGIFGYIIDAIVAVVAIVTAQPELLVALGAMIALQQTGTLAKMTKGIAEGLEKMGMGKDIANMVASLIIMVAMIAVTAGAGAAGGAASAAAEGAGEASVEVGTEEAGTEVEMAELGSAGAEGAEGAEGTEGAEEASKGSKLAEGAAKGMARALKVGVPMAIMGSNSLVETVETIVAKARHESVKQLDKEIKWLRALLTVIQAVVAMVVGGGLSKLGSAAEEGAAAESKLGKAIEAFKKLNIKGITMESVVNKVATVGMTYSVGAKATIDMEQKDLAQKMASLLRKIGQGEAATQLFDQLIQTMTKMTKDQLAATGQNASIAIQSLNQTIQQMGASDDEAANLLASTSV